MDKLLKKLGYIKEYKDQNEIDKMKKKINELTISINKIKG